MSTKLFVGGIPYTSTEQELQDFFSSVGTVTEARIISDRFSGRSKGFGFVTMSTEEEAKAAIEQLNGKELGGRTIVVSEARPQQPRPDNGDRPHRRDRDN